MQEQTGRSADGPRERWFGDPTRVELVGFVYGDEIGYGESGDDWVFLLGIHQPRQRRGAGTPTLPARSERIFVRGMRAGRTDVGLRVPQLGALGAKSVAVVGLGALGAPAALTLARSGVGDLTLIDHDVVEAGTQPRWPAGARAANHFKADYLAGLIAADYLFCSAKPHRLVIGRSDPAELEVLGEVLDRSDLILDATANLAVNDALAALAFERGLPYVLVSATEGAWGGLVARLERGRTACFQCLLGVLGEAVALPPRDESGSVAPVGCFESTFTGPGFDLTPLADEAVRLVVSTLSEDSTGSYPAVGWDLETLALRDGAGNLVPPTWTAHQLGPDPTGACPICGDG